MNEKPLTDKEFEELIASGEALLAKSSRSSAELKTVMANLRRSGEDMTRESERLLNEYGRMVVQDGLLETRRTDRFRHYIEADKQFEREHAAELEELERRGKPENERRGLFGFGKRK